MSPVGHVITATALSYCIVSAEGIAWKNVVLGVWNQPFLTFAPYISHEQPVSILAIGIILGARFPDRLEIPFINRFSNTRESLIPHRTLTHSPWVWVLASTLGFFLYSSANSLGWLVGSLFFLGVCTASWLHIGFDLMTPAGIPLLNPFGERFSLNLYKSGSLKESLVIGAFLLICLFFPHLR